MPRRTPAVYGSRRSGAGPASGFARRPVFRAKSSPPCFLFRLRSCGDGNTHLGCVYMESEQPSGELTVRTIAMPADTNANGDIFGGWVMSQMDQAGGIAGVERAQGRVVTVAVDAMHFIRPVRVGDVLCVYTRVDRVG